MVEPQLNDIRNPIELAEIFGYEVFNRRFMTKDLGG
jgi:hypothetical protein